MGSENEEHPGRSREGYRRLWGELFSPDAPEHESELGQNAALPDTPDARESSSLQGIHPIKAALGELQDLMLLVKGCVDRIEAMEAVQQQILADIQRQLHLLSSQPRLRRERIPSRSEMELARSINPTRSQDSNDKTFATGLTGSYGKAIPASSLVLSLTIGALIAGLTALAGIGSASTEPVTLTWVNLLLGVGTALVLVGIAMRPRDNQSKLKRK